MGDTAQRCLDASEHHRHIGIELFENLRIDDGRIFRAHVMTTVRAVCILGTQTACSGIFIHHRVHATWSDAEEQTRTTQFLEVAIVTMPVRLWHYGHTIACGLECASYHSSSKGRMVNIGVAREQDNIYFVPSSEIQLLLRRRQKICQFIIQCSIFN